MKFEWSARKSKSNEHKHGITFEMAVIAFHDPFILMALDNRYCHIEERWKTLGLAQQNIIYIVHTIEENEYGEEIIRIISARKATPSETRRYYINRKDDETIQGSQTSQGRPH